MSSFIKTLAKGRAAYLVLVLLAFLLTACGGGGGGGGGSEPALEDPAEGVTWDKMEWDKGKWG